MVVQGIKPFVERLLALGTEISLATVRSFAVFMRAGMTTKPTFHKLGSRVDVSLLYLTHHDLMHYQMERWMAKTSEVFVKKCLVPQLWLGAVVVMDNLPAHKLASITPLIRAVGADVLNLSPNFTRF